jgi:hypothetical protein
VSPHFSHELPAVIEQVRWIGLASFKAAAAWRRAFFWLFVAALAYPFVAFAVLGLLKALGIPASHMISMGKRLVPISSPWNRLTPQQPADAAGQAGAARQLAVRFIEWTPRFPSGAGERHRPDIVDGRTSAIERALRLVPISTIPGVKLDRTPSDVARNGHGPVAIPNRP